MKKQLWNERTCFLSQMPVTSISKDGLSGKILFAGNYVKVEPEYYGFMTL